MRTERHNDITKDPSGFVLLADYVPHIVQEIRYYATYNFIGERIDGYEEPCALLTIEAARALKGAANELFVQGYRLKVFDAVLFFQDHPEHPASCGASRIRIFA